MLDAYQSSRCNCELSTLPILHQSFLVFCDSDVISYFEQSQQFNEKSDVIAATEWDSSDCSLTSHSRQLHVQS